VAVAVLACFLDVPRNVLCLGYHCSTQCYQYWTGTGGTGWSGCFWPKTGPNWACEPELAGSVLNRPVRDRFGQFVPSQVNVKKLCFFIF